jgi:hypothetical protein
MCHVLNLSKQHLKKREIMQWPKKITKNSYKITLVKWVQNHWTRYCPKMRTIKAMCIPLKENETRNTIKRR